MSCFLNMSQVLWKSFCMSVPCSTSCFFPTISNRVSWPLYYYIFAMFSHGASILSLILSLRSRWAMGDLRRQDLVQDRGGPRGADANVKGIEGVEQRTFWNLRDLKFVLTCSHVLKASESILDSFQCLWKDVLSNSWWKQWKLWVCTAWAFRHRWERWKSARMQPRFCRSPETSRTCAYRTSKCGENLTDARCKEQIDAFQPYLPIAFSLAANCHLFRSTDASNAPIEGGGGKWRWNDSWFSVFEESWSVYRKDRKGSEYFRVVYLCSLKIALCRRSLACAMRACASAIGTRSKHRVLETFTDTQIHSETLVQHLAMSCNVFIYCLNIYVCSFNMV